MTASAPSRTAIAMSETSALVGVGWLIMLSSMFVATITGFCILWHLRMISLCMNYEKGIPLTSWSLDKFEMRSRVIIWKHDIIAYTIYTQRNERAHSLDASILNRWCNRSRSDREQCYMAKESSQNDVTSFHWVKSRQLMCII